jgi:hypothetical protein
MQSTAERLKAVGAFLVHALVSTIGVIVVSACLIFALYSNLRTWRPPFTAKGPSWILTEMPGFPIQAIVGLSLGLLAGKYTRSNFAMWTWVLPGAILCIAMILEPRNDPSILAHYFGRGCNPANRCFDQLGFTLPFLAAVAYGVGALLSRKLYTHTS